MARKTYSDEKKAEVKNYIETYNQKHGRGGQSAARKKYGISMMTLSKWMGGDNSRSGRNTSANNGGSKDPLKILQKMMAVQKKIEGLRRQFVSLEKKL